MIRLIGGAFYKEKKTRKELARFIQTADRFSFSRECLKFEKDFAAWQGRKYAIFVNSGSSANLALFQALLNLGRLKRGDNVGFSAVTWSTNVMPLMNLGLTPIPIDIELSTLNIGSKEVEKAIKKHKIKALFITNLLGFSHDLGRIKKLCKKNNVLLLEDNCESLGSVEGGVKLGNFGLASTFSFYIGHHFSTLEGGMVTTDDKALADAMRLVRAHGWDRHLDEKQQKKLRSVHGIEDFHALFTFYDVAYNLRPCEIQGFLGNVQLRYADEIVRRRENTYKEFIRKASQSKGYGIPRITHMDTISAFALPIVCSTREQKNKVIAACKGVVEIRPIVGGSMVAQPFFKKYYPKAPKEFPCPNAARVHAHGLYMPIHPDMTAKEKSIITELLSSL